MTQILTEEDVAEIMALAYQGPAREVAVRYGVATETIRKIWRGDSHRTGNGISHVKRKREAGRMSEEEAAESARRVRERALERQMEGAPEWMRDILRKEDGNG